jgi:Macrocin-O-methyltransferase (TylF)
MFYSAKRLVRRTLQDWRHTRLARKNPLVAACIERVKTKKLSYLKEDALWDLAEAVRDLERSGIEGTLVEAGCALGGSALVIAAAKSADRPFLVFDTFGLIPPPSEPDGPDVWERYRIISEGKSTGINGDPYYGYEADLLAKVTQTFRDFDLETERNRIQLIKGDYRDTLRLNQPVALAHIDCDWYESVLVCLNAIEPRLVRGGRLVLDDYDSWSGCRRAVDAYFADRHGVRFVQKSRMHVIKM